MCLLSPPQDPLVILEYGLQPLHCVTGGFPARRHLWYTGTTKSFELTYYLTPPAFFNWYQVLVLVLEPQGLLSE